MKTHGHRTGRSTSPTYHSWDSMRRRTSDPKRDNWKYYGGRGITMCDRWKKFDHFLEDMGERLEGTTLDRIDVNGNYCKDNCRWATRDVQDKNKRYRFRD